MYRELIVIPQHRDPCFIILCACASEYYFLVPYFKSSNYGTILQLLSYCTVDHSMRRYFIILETDCRDRRSTVFLLDDVACFCSILADDDVLQTSPVIVSTLSIVPYSRPPSKAFSSHSYSTSKSSSKRSNRHQSQK